MPGMRLYMLLLTFKKCCMGRVCFPILLGRKPRLGEEGICSRSHSEIKDNWDLRLDLFHYSQQTPETAVPLVIIKIGSCNIYSAFAPSQALC